jgi:hypothetical protein
MAKGPEHSEIQNVFAMNEPLHMVAKLMWELENLTKSMSVWTDNKGYAVPIFAAFNTPVTAWHITDWLWQSNPQTRAVLARRYNFTFNEWKPKDLRAALVRFQNAVATDSRALYICREIANGSKHMRTDKVDPNVKAVAKWDPVVEGVGLVKPGDLVTSLTIQDGEKTHDAARLFIEAFGYWEQLFTKEKLIIGKTRLPDKIIKSS